MKTHKFNTTEVNLTMDRREAEVIKRYLSRAELDLPQDHIEAIILANVVLDIHRQLGG